MIQTKKMLAISHPVLFDLNFTGIMGERVSLQGVPFDQLSEPLQELLRIELLLYFSNRMISGHSQWPLYAPFIFSSKFNP